MNWVEAFEKAAKEPEGRLGVELEPPAFAKALRALDMEYSGLERGDERYQRACREGWLEWFNEVGHCVVISRKKPEEKR